MRPKIKKTKLEILNGLQCKNLNFLKFLNGTADMFWAVENLRTRWPELLSSYGARICVSRSDVTNTDF